MAGRKKTNGDTQGASNVTIALTQRGDDLTKILAAFTGIKRAKVLWYLLGRGIEQWIEDGVIYDPNNLTNEIIEKAFQQVANDPKYAATIERLAIEIPERGEEFVEGDSAPFNVSE